MKKENMLQKIVARLEGAASNDMDDSDIHQELLDNQRQTQDELALLRVKTEFFREALRAVHYRSPAAVHNEVEEHCRILSGCKREYIPFFIEKKYQRDFWYNEPDVIFKKELLKRLRQVLKEELTPPIVNSLLESVADDDEGKFMTSWIEI